MDHSALLNELNKAMDKRVLTTLSEREKIVSGLSTGSLNLNVALSGNPFVGFVWGRITGHFSGSRSSAKRESWRSIP